MTGAELLAKELKDRGVGFVATLCGHGLDPFDAACRAAGIELVDVRNEQAAAYMAEAVGRLSRTVGVCAASSGVAHVNALSGVLNAWFDGAPMLLITGCGPMDTIGQGHFQDMDQVALADPICKFARRIDHPEEIPALLDEAFSAALTPRPGPVHLTLPTDVQDAKVEDLRYVPRRTESAALAADQNEAVDTVAEWMSEAARPLIVAGSSLYYTRGEAALESFVTAHDIPVTVPIWDRGSVPSPLSQFVGVIGAATGGPSLLPEADLVLVLGARADYRIGYLRPPGVSSQAGIVSVSEDADSLSQGAVDLAVHADPSRFLGALSQAFAEGKTYAEWMTSARSMRDAFRESCRAAAPTEGLRAIDVVDAVGAVLTDETILILDGGNIGQWAHQLLCDRYPGHWLTCGASGVVGYGLPAAMAARKLYPDKPIILVSGDGSMTFTIAELESAARQKLGFVVVVADDQAWGITLTGHSRKFGEGITSELGPIDFPALASALGACGIGVQTRGEIEGEIRRGLESDVPHLVHVPIVRSNPSPDA